MPLTRTFRSGMSLGHNGRQQPIRSNFQSGPGASTAFPSTAPKGYGTGQGYTTGQGYGTGGGYGTGQSEEAPVTPLTRTSAPSGMAAPSAPRTGMSRSAPSYSPSAYGGQPKSTTGANGMPSSPPAIRSSLTPALPAATPTALNPALDTPGAGVTSPSTTPAAVTSPKPAQNDPLTGAGTTGGQLPGSVADVDPGQAMGFSARGGTTPAGDDAQPDPNVGGTGLYARKFGSPKSAGIYGDYVKKLFGSSGA